MPLGGRLCTPAVGLLNGQPEETNSGRSSCRAIVRATRRATARRRAAVHLQPPPKSAEQAHQDVQLLLAEDQRRETVPPSEARPDADMTAKTERQLGAALRKARDRYNRYPPGSNRGQATGRAIDLLYAEYRRRGLTIPGLPASRAEEATVEYVGHIDFTEAAMPRLKELLDMYQHDLIRGEPGDVTYADAGRDIRLIEEELQRRGVKRDDAAEGA
jgi:hypothetical protein